MPSTTPSDNEKVVELPKPKRDDLTGGLIGPLDYGNALTVYKAKKDATFTPRPQRFYASDVGHCFYKTWCKRTKVPMDEGNTGFDDGIGERGDATEAQITKVLREVHGEDAVLQNVRFSKRLMVGDTEVALVFKSDPVLIGDNLDILQFWEIKSKGTNAWRSNKKLSALLKDGLQKVPLFMARIDGPEGEGGANFDNALQAALGFKLARTEAGKRPNQPILHYVNSDKHTDYVSIVMSESDVDVLAEIARRWIEEYFAYEHSGTPPPPQFAMDYECRYCDWKNNCALRCKTENIERQIHPLAGSVNAALERARKLYAKKEEDPAVKMAHEILAEAEAEVERLDQQYINAALEEA